MNEELININMDRSTKEEGELSDDDVSLDEVMSLQYNNQIEIHSKTKPSSTSSNANGPLMLCRNQNYSPSLKMLSSSTKPKSLHEGSPKQSVNKPVRTKRRGHRSGQNNKQGNRPVDFNVNSNGFPRPIQPQLGRCTNKNPYAMTEPQPVCNNNTKGRSFLRKPMQQNYKIPLSPSQFPNQHNRGAPYRPMMSRFSAHNSKKDTPVEDNFEDLLRQHQIIQKQLAELEELSPNSPQQNTDDDMNEVQITKVEHLSGAKNNLRKKSPADSESEPKTASIASHKVSEEEDTEIMELRRLALASTKNESLPFIKNKHNLNTKNSTSLLDSNKMTHVSNRPTYKSPAQSVRRKYSRYCKETRKRHSERNWRYSDERESNYSNGGVSHNAKEDMKRHLDERSRLKKEIHDERRKRIESDEQRREIQKILSLDDPEEQAERFLKYLNYHRRDQSKLDAFDVLTSQKNIANKSFKRNNNNIKDNLFSTSEKIIQLQDNYEEVEMDIDSNPGSPVKGEIMEELYDDDYQSAMQPVPYLTTAEPYIPEQIDLQNLWLKGDQAQLPYSSFVYGAFPAAPVLIEPPPPPPPPPPIDLPQEQVEHRPPLPPMEDEDAETAILRQQLLQSLMEKRKHNEIGKLSTNNETSMSSPPSSIQSDSSLSIKKNFPIVKTVPTLKPVVINLEGSSSEEDNSTAVANSTISILGGLDDFLKEARKSSEIKGAVEKTKTMTERVMEIKEREKELSSQREIITKDQGLLKTLINRAKNYQRSLKTAQQKVKSLHEQLMAAEKISSANKVQVEKTKAQARQVKDSLLKKKDKLKVTEEVVIKLGCEVYGENYKPRHIVKENSPSKRKVAKLDFTDELDSHSAIKMSKTVLLTTKQHAPTVPHKVPKKIAKDKIVEEKKRLQQLEREFAEKILRLKEAHALKAVQTGSLFRSQKNKTKLKGSEQTLDTIKLSDSQSEICPSKAKHELSHNKKLNIQPTKQPLVGNYSTSIKHVMFKTPCSDQQSNLCKLQMTPCDIVNNKVNMNIIDSSVDYTSPLLHFKSYRLSSYFRTKECKSVWSPTFSNKINPNQILCSFELQGTCNDDKCTGQHINDIMLSERSIMEDIVSHCPKLAGIQSNTSRADYPKYINKYIQHMINVHQSKMSSDEIGLLLISKVTEAANKAPPFTMFYEARNWKPYPTIHLSSIPTSNNPQVPQYISEEDV
ncbi:zinc finger C3H1 domain-containing protein [Patella vulgata]|uniref:zinc finger C3H1 domain-containing protein n=1 Tax=Patella vulgata TaxID=6465 RepID=UPI0024A8BD0B|nr:zinc finger C3H1 domain-containing protein [Patella vulgata]